MLLLPFFLGYGSLDLYVYPQKATESDGFLDVPQSHACKLHDYCSLRLSGVMGLKIYCFTQEKIQIVFRVPGAGPFFVCSENKLAVDMCVCLKVVSNGRRSFADFSESVSFVEEFEPPLQSA